MNYRRGLFRLWVIVNVLWIAYSGWQFWNSCTDQAGILFYEWCSTGQGDWLKELRYFEFQDVARIAARAVNVPIILLGLGYAILWIGTGFKRRQP